MNTFFDDDLKSDRTLSAVQELRPVAEGLGLTMAQLALAWVLRRSELASAIIGASRPSQVDDNVAASGVKLSPATLEEIDRITLPILRFSASTN